MAKASKKLNKEPSVESLSASRRAAEIYAAQQVVDEAQHNLTELLTGVPQAERPKGGKGNRTPAVEQVVLVMLAKGYSYAKAGEAAGVSRDQIFYWKRQDGEFAKKCDDAFEAGTDFFEDEARRRAAEGVNRPVFQGGQLVGSTKEYSDSLLVMTLGGRRPERYGKKVEHSGPGGKPIQHKIEVEFVDGEDD